MSMKLLVHPLEPYRPDSSYWVVPREEQDYIRSLLFMVGAEDDWGPILLRAAAVRLSKLFVTTHRLNIPLTVDISQLPVHHKQNFKYYYFPTALTALRGDRFWTINNYSNVSIVDGKEVLTCPRD